MGKTFEIYCKLHPTEFHDTLSFQETANKTATINLDVRLDTDERCNCSWKVPMDYLIEFEKNLNETHIAVLEDKDNLLAMKLENEKMYFIIFIVKIAGRDEAGGIRSDYWVEIKEKQ